MSLSIFNSLDIVDYQLCYFHHNYDEKDLRHPGLWCNHQRDNYTNHDSGDYLPSKTPLLGSTGLCGVPGR